VDVLTVGDRPVAHYVTEPDADPRRGPRPYLHPVRTMAGTLVTDVLPEDHPHHLGVSVALQSVARPGEPGVNLWGGRTYVRDAGYTWLADHGRIEHAGWIKQENSQLANRMRWLAPDGSVLLDEERVMSATPVDADTWRLDVAYTLTNPGRVPVVLGSPATNGRPGRAGYGGFFWRAAPGTARVLDPVSSDEAEVNGSTRSWVALIGADEAFTLVFSGLGEGDHWFVRAAEYPGVCVALAFEHTRELQPGDSLARAHQILVCDGPRTRAEIVERIGS
jgi:hypothetical protein